MYEFGKGIPVLTYHALHSGNPSSHEDVGSFYSVGIDCFERQVSFLKDGGHSTPLVEDLRRNLEQHEKTVCITFDDGFKSDIEFALPVLQKHALRATFFVVVDRIGKDGYMSWSDLLEVRARGSAIQCHGFRHDDLTTIEESQLVNDLTRARSTMEDKLGAKVDCLALPYGNGDEKVFRIAREVGFEVVLTSQQRLASAHDNPLPRFVIHSRTSYEDFIRIVTRDGGRLLSAAVRQYGLEMAKSLLGSERYALLKSRLFG